jgi:hypothetical protein
MLETNEVRTFMKICFYIDFSYENPRDYFTCMLRSYTVSEVPAFSSSLHFNNAFHFIWIIKLILN